MTWTPPNPAPIVADRRNPNTNFEADIPAVLDWLRTQPAYAGRTVRGVLITGLDTGNMFKVIAEPAYGTPGTWDNYTLEKIGKVVTYAGQDVDEIYLLPGLTGDMLGSTLRVGLQLDLSQWGASSSVGGTMEWGTPTGPTIGTASGGGPYTFTYTSHAALRITHIDLIGSLSSTDAVPVGTAVSLSAGGQTVSGTLSTLSAGIGYEYDRTLTLSTPLDVPDGSTLTLSLGGSAYIYKVGSSAGQASTDGYLTYGGGGAGVGLPWVRFTSVGTLGDGSVTGQLPAEAVDLSEYALTADVATAIASTTDLITEVAGDVADVSARVTALESAALDVEAIDDEVARLLGSSGTYDDAANTYTISVPAATTQEQVEDWVAALISVSGGTVTYNDAAGTLTITTASAPVTSVAGKTGAVTLTVTDVSGAAAQSDLTALTTRVTSLEGSALNLEAVQDAVAAMLGTVGTYNDAAGTYTITLPSPRTDEEIQDVVAALIQVSGSTISKTYDDAGNVLTLTVTASSGGGSSTPDILPIGSVRAYVDISQAYIPSGFTTDGTQIYGQRDDNNDARATPVTVRFAAMDFTTAYHMANGGVQFVGPTPDAVGANFGALFHNAIGVGVSRMASAYAGFAMDLYESWRREVTLSDGFAWHVVTGTSGYTANIKYTIRYVTASKKWIVTLFHHAQSTSQKVITIRAAGIEWSFASLYTPNEADPTTALCVVVQC